MLSNHQAAAVMNFTRQRLAMGSRVSCTGKLMEVSSAYTAGFGNSSR
jgi:hypothetical protein